MDQEKIEYWFAVLMNELTSGTAPEVAIVNATRDMAQVFEIGPVANDHQLAKTGEPFTMQSPPANPDAAFCQPTPPDASGKASECKWVVGQWVDFCGGPMQITNIGEVITIIGWKTGAYQFSLDTKAIKPFEWQGGRTYKTTLDGVTATIDESYTSSVVCKLSNGIGRLIFNNRTGKPIGCDTAANVPCLLPFLADEHLFTPPVDHPSSKIERAAQKALEKMDECNETIRQSELKIKNDEATIEKLFGYPVSEIGDKLDRLQSFEKVAEALWPFVRYFIIAGACPEAINCVVDLGRLLGHTEASKSTIAEIGERVRAETLDEVAVRLESLLRGKVLSKHLPEVTDAVRKM